MDILVKLITLHIISHQLLNIEYHVYENPFNCIS